MSLEDVEAVRAACLDYVEGMYDLEPDRIQRSVHVEMAKRGFARQPYVELPMTQPELVNKGKNGLRDDGKKIEAGARKEVVIYEVLDQTASVKLLACWGVDFMHLAKYDGKWKVVNVMWQTYPPTIKREKMKLFYWKIRGLAAPLRMLCCYAGQEYEDTQLQATKTDDGEWDDGCWFKDLKPKMLAENAMLNLPCIQYAGMTITHSNACLLFLGRQFGLSGRTEQEIAFNEEVLCQVMDLRNDLVKVVYPFDTPEEKYPEAIKLHFESVVPAHYGKLESWLAQNGSPFFSGSSPLTGDFHAFEMVDQHEALARTLDMPSPFASYPKLQEFHKRFLNIPQLQPYFGGPDYKLPINDVMAYVK
mmetsp:Transcript_75247/g.178788  ORF Transcript_75247/g.178788 Transcript_75247/m.178788 type:complete len:361 (+) Transcript_75247:71-1153(+)